MKRSGASRGDGRSEVRVAEIVGAIALAADLGLGQPLGHVLRSCVIATRLAEHLGVSPADYDATYWVTLFLTVGCTGVSFETSNLFGDDIAFRSGFLSVGASDAERVRYLLGRAGSNRGVLIRTKIQANLLRTSFAPFAESLIGHCAVSARLAGRLGLGPPVVTSLQQTFARWDGKGVPRGLAGEAILLPVRIATIANLAEVQIRDHGLEASIPLMRAFGGTAFDPTLVSTWCAAAPEIMAGIDDESSWERVVAAQPTGRGSLSEAELDDALELIADYADLKSPWFTGHSRGVASLARAAAHGVGLPDGDVATLHRAALLHDLGRNGVPNTIWDKPGALTTEEMERVRLHAYYTDRILHRAGGLAELAGIASAAHERNDGSGYPRELSAGSIPLLGRYLEAADTYHALLEDRPHRSALTRDEASTHLRRAAQAGVLDGQATDAVLTAAGHSPRRKPTLAAGLTPREIEVLVLVAQGSTTRAVANVLHITPKTAGNHIERIYEKIGVSSRAEAAMFAMQHGLVAGWETQRT